jgi:hypothetical protein
MLKCEGVVAERLHRNMTVRDSSNGRVVVEEVDVPRSLTIVAHEIAVARRSYINHRQLHYPSNQSIHTTCDRLHSLSALVLLASML